ncbi:MAG: hypothetical protein H6713_33305 [Myxococcales bacterium]|nr:hypothetical protein [Myxococcales bacterium]
MGTSVRVFVVLEDDTIERFPTSRYERLSARGEDVRVERFAGRRVRFATAFVELDQRQPVSIQHISFDLVQFDGEGRLDRDSQDRALTLAINLLNRDDSRGGVIDASARFARRELDHNHRWSPSETQLRALVAAAMAPPRPRSRRASRRARLRVVEPGSS